MLNQLFLYQLLYLHQFQHFLLVIFKSNFFSGIILSSLSSAWNKTSRNGHVQSSSSINPFFVEDINIVTGPAAVVYGDGAMGGAMVINTIAIKSKKENILKQQFETSSNSVSINYMGVNSFKKIITKKFKKLNLNFGPQHPAAPAPYTHLRPHETVLDLVCRLLLEKKKKKKNKTKTKL